MIVKRNEELNGLYNELTNLQWALKRSEERNQELSSDLARMKAAMEECEEALELVDQWKHGLRHRTAHESKMVDAAEQALAALKGTEI